MGKLLPILMLLVGVGAGIGAGIVLAPAPAPEEEMHAEGDAAMTQGEHAGDGHDTSMQGGETGDAGHNKGAKPKPPAKPASSSGEEGEEANAPEFVKLNNQFVVPVVAAGKVEALVVLTLSLETMQGLRETIYNREPKLRDAFLQVLFDHSNMGGFQGAFTRSNNLDILRSALLEVAQNEFGYDVYNVLIIDIARQDV
ncbi:MAG: flagellar basal body-associated protein FliL [Rhodobacteraceae bacterium]|nr:flagellar basal body-associated protein FliL [Paracoccaceae bacterium]